MIPKRHSRFILLDLCHPMRTDTVKTVIESLENALVLGLSLPLNGIQFGIFVLNSDFKIIQPSYDSQQNYVTIYKALQHLLQITKEDTKVTVRKYKELISQLLDTIFREYLSKLGNNKCSKHLETVSIQVAVITKKTASVLVEILTDILNKLEETNLCAVSAVKKFKIVKILNENEEFYEIQQKNDLIECTTCLSHPHYLTYFFKDWLLNPEEYMEITLNEHMNFILKCDIDNCIIEPISPLFNQKIHAKTFERISSLDKLKPKSLEVISRIPISRFCPTLMFGNPRRITATLNKALAWEELEKNRQLFKGLCLELQSAAQGLLTTSSVQMDGHEIFTFQFIISVGDMLLMNDVAPEELYLPKEIKPLKVDKADEDAISLVKICLENIKVLDQYCPRYFASGINEYLTNYLIRPKGSNITSKRFNSNCPEQRKFLPRTHQNDTRNLENENCQLMKKQKFNLDAKFKEMLAIHPALLPQDMVQKYRKINSKAFNLPELGQDFSKDLVHWY